MQTRSTLGSYIVNGRRRSSRFRGATSSASAPSSSPSRSSRSTPPSTPPSDARVNVGGKRKRARSDGDRDERPRKKQKQKKEDSPHEGQEKEQEEQTDRIVEEAAAPDEGQERPLQMTALLPSPEITDEPEGLSEPIYIPAELDEGPLAHAYDTDDELREEKEIQTLKLNSVKWDRVLENYKADEREEDRDDEEAPDEVCIPFRRSPAPEPRTPPPQAASTPGTVPSAPWRPTTTRPPRGLVRRSPTPPTEAGSLRRTYQLDPKTMREMEPGYKSRYQYRWSARYNPYDAAWDDADGL